MSFDIEEKEKEREARLFKQTIEAFARKARSVVRVESSGKEIKPKLRENFMPTSAEILEGVRVKINLANIYRRYRCVRIRALMEARAIIKRNKTKQQNISDIEKLIVKALQAHRKSTE